ncbi:hypothetical protein PMI01_02830 [Caulobacter sp. AP07]|uniref:hypothetical protein n=1 Tax=Caulobacter sp. AP07 TaxID=1144304 RepID=UPI0002722530|nr:hypothetical protein [Caulobacter sp. AP07]EJL31296.1 hypothetical protein PMI01_02830 [Caulobacter sp. AP07]
MNALLRAINPARSVRTEGEAKAAAQAGALGAFLMAAYGVVVAVILVMTAESYVANARAFAPVLYGRGSEAARMVAATISPAWIYGLAIWSLICALGAAGLGVVQWGKLTRLIPMILGLFALYGLLMFGLGKINGSPLAGQMPVPLWREILWLVVNLAEIVLFWAGFRGGRQLLALRREAV